MFLLCGLINKNNYDFYILNKMEDNNVIHYLNILYKLNEISTYIKDTNIDQNILQNIKEGKQTCINYLVSNQKIKLLLDEVQTPEEEPDELKDQIDTLANLLGNTIQTPIDETNISPQQFDTLGNGLVRLFKGTVEPQQLEQDKNSQIKNELNLFNSNINLQIKKK